MVIRHSLILICALLTGCATGPDQPRLTAATVIQLADAEARRHGYDLRAYERPRVHYNFVTRDDTSWVSSRFVACERTRRKRPIGQRHEQSSARRSFSGSSRALASIPAASRAIGCSKRTLVICHGGGGTSQGRQTITHFIRRLRTM